MLYPMLWWRENWAESKSVNHPLNQSTKAPKNYLSLQLFCKSFFVSMCVHELLCACVHVCAGWGTAMGVGFPTSTLFEIGLLWAPRNLPASTFPLSTGPLRLQTDRRCAWLFLWALVIWTQAKTFARQAFYPLRYPLKAYSGHFLRECTHPRKRLSLYTTYSCLLYFLYLKKKNQNTWGLSRWFSG